MGPPVVQGLALVPTPKPPRNRPANMHPSPPSAEKNDGFCRECAARPRRTHRYGL